MKSDMKKTYKKITLTFISSLFFYAFSFGCTQAPPTTPNITVTSCSASVYEITFFGYTTFGGSIGGNCACGFALPPSINAVQSVQVINAATGLPISQLSFTPNATTAGGFNGISAGNWTGFSSSVLNAIPSGLSINIVFTVTITTCVTVTIINELMALSPAIGTAGADNTGLPVDHIEIEDIADVELPIELGYFQAHSDQKQVELSWQTLSETNNDYFAVEHAVDGRNFEEITKIPGAGNTYDLKQYSYIDRMPFDGTNYYRLKQVDFDGRFTYSDIVVVVMGTKHNTPLEAFPIPAIDRVTLAYHGKDKGTVQVEIYDWQGNALWAKEIPVSKGNNAIPLNLIPYEAGIYLVAIRDPFEPILTTKILKL